MRKRVRHAPIAVLAACLVLSGAAGAQAQRTAASPANTRVTGPALTQFNAAKVFDVTRPAAAMVVDFKARDDLSGVDWVVAWAYGPDRDIHITVRWDSLFPKGLIAAQMSTRPDFMHAYLAPGAYTFFFAQIEDEAGNRRSYEGDELASLGNTTFTVVNPSGHDGMDPSLQAGEVLTPTVSLSRYKPMGVRVEAVDAGEYAASGVKYINIAFCQLGTQTCIHGSAENWRPPGQAEWKATLGLDFAGGAVPGVYHLRSLSIGDRAGYSVGMLSHLFDEGWFDFDAYFPTTTITVTP